MARLRCPLLDSAVVIMRIGRECHALLVVVLSTISSRTSAVARRDLLGRCCRGLGEIRRCGWHSLRESQCCDRSLTLGLVSCEAVAWIDDVSPNKSLERTREG